MSYTPFADRLLDAIDRKRAPICVGLDPVYDMLPEIVKAKAAGRGASRHEQELDAIFQFCIGVLRVVAPLVPAVKLQSAYFERYRWDGVEAYYSLVHEAREMGLLVIGDVKRGDIGSTSEAYAEAHLADDMAGDGDADAEFATPDAITVSPMLGLDTLQPFFAAAAEHAKGLFVLVRTSNSGSGALQDVLLEDRRTWSEALADQLRDATAKQPAGRHGYGSVGAVVGATQPQTMASLRARLPRSIFLLPGYGMQGATADMTRAAFVDGRGAIISASRSILNAHLDAQHNAAGDWQAAVRSATLAMRTDVQQMLGLT